MPAVIDPSAALLLRADTATCPGIIWRGGGGNRQRGGVSRLDADRRRAVRCRAVPPPALVGGRTALVGRSSVGACR